MKFTRIKVVNVMTGKEDRSWTYRYYDAINNDYAISLPKKFRLSIR